MCLKFNIRARSKIELEKVVSDLGTTLSREHVHVVVANSQCKVATGWWNTSRLFYLVFNYLY